MRKVAIAALPRLTDSTNYAVADYCGVKNGLLPPLQLSILPS